MHIIKYLQFIFYEKIFTVHSNKCISFSDKDIFFFEETKGISLKETRRAI